MVMSTAVPKVATVLKKRSSRSSAVRKTSGTKTSPPANVMRVALHPDGMAPRIVNFGEWRAHLLERLRHQASVTGDAALAALYEEVSGYPGPPDADDHHGTGGEVFVPLVFRADGRELRFFSTVATFGTAVDITMSELAIESFFPADAVTAEALRSA